VKLNDLLHFDMEMVIYVQLNMYVRKLCEEFILENENYPKEFVDKTKKVN
jgi:hypothetical protein